MLAPQNTAQRCVAIMEAPRVVYKVALVGDSDVGKTYLSSKYIRNSPPAHPGHTIGVEFATKTVAFKPGGSGQLKLWDFSGQERFRAITSGHLSDAVGVIIVFDLTQASSFQGAAGWLEIVRNKCDPNVLLMLLGNKSDLLHENPWLRAVTGENAQAFATRNSMTYMEVSAVSGVGLKEAFEVFLDEIHRRAHLPA